MECRNCSRSIGFISLLDSDDIWSATKLAKQLKYFSDHPSTDCVVGRVQYFLSDGQSIPPGFKPSLLEGSHIAYMPGTSMIRRSIFEDFGRLNPNGRSQTISFGLPNYASQEEP